MPKKKKNKTNNDNRFRCLVPGCNPALFGQAAALAHSRERGHRTAKWPVRSAEGERRAQARNKSGYYDKYNVGPKARSVRLGDTEPRESPPSAPVPGEEWCGDDWDIWGNEYAWGEDDF